MIWLVEDMETERMDMIKFSRLERNCRQPVTEEMMHYKMAVLGNCSTQHLAKAVKGYAYEMQIALDVFDADYDQIDAQILNTDSEFYDFAPEFTVLFMCSEKLYDSFVLMTQTEKHLFAETTLARIQKYWRRMSSNINTKIIQFNFAQIDESVFGNYACKTEDSFLYQVRKLNYLLMQAALEYKNVFLFDLDRVQSLYGQETLMDPKMYYIAKLPISIKMLPEIARQIMQIVVAIRGKIKKCVICDLDNTLWGGVIGDDGIENIQIGELGLGHAFSDLQAWLKELKRRGIILAICSKNDEATAKQPFLSHPEMILRMEDISIFVANWEDKVSNIRSIQRTLNIGMDSIVFLDDNPFERNLVKSMIPEITVPELPEDPSLYCSYLKRLNLFETASYSEEDAIRTRQYQEEAKRLSLEKEYSSYEEYLESLEMQAIAKPFDKLHYSRIAQLTQRSNQFNLCTGRYSEAEIEQLTKDDKHDTLYFCLKDRFGDYGLICVAIMNEISDTEILIQEFLMSCRVLKRGMEEFVMDTIVAMARDRGFHTVRGRYIPTQKNAMVSDLYERMGFRNLDNNYFIADVEGYQYHKTYIIKEGDRVNE